MRNHLFMTAAAALALAAWLAAATPQSPLVRAGAERGEGVPAQRLSRGSGWSPDEMD